MIAFVVAVIILLITPGPGVLSTAGVGSGFGFRPGLGYVFGLFVGNNLVGLAVVSGVAAAVLSVPYMRVLLLGASAAYLLYLAARIALSGSKIGFIESTEAPGVKNGVLLQIINPKAYAVHTALFSGFAFWPDSLLVEVAVKFVLMNLFWVPIHLLWLGMGATMKRLALSERANRAINILMALSMLGVVALTLRS
ncbi:MAG: LysE family transporter [Magnetovibrio sp.]|nr:LysE family transporter [Magnetovibrio sp.]